MIRGIWIDGRLCPHFICEWCDKPITDADQGHVLFDDQKKDEHGRIEMHHLHKGQCDQSFEGLHGRDGHMSWTPLPWHLVFLTTNSGTTPEALKAERDKLQEMGI